MINACLASQAAPAPIPALTLPRTLYAARAIRSLPTELESLGVRRPLVVTDKGLTAAGLAAKVVTLKRGVR
jgi:4-hydroxybutyrate dehydrogenase